MRTYLVESDFFEQCLQRVKKLTNVQWLSIGAVLSFVVFLFLVTTSPSSSKLQEIQLRPYEIHVIPLSSLRLSSRAFYFGGNVNATNVFITNKCPVYAVVEQEKIIRSYNVERRGRTDADFDLLQGNVVSMTIESIGGDSMVHIFTSKEDETNFQLHRAGAKEKNLAIFQDDILMGTPLTHSFTVTETARHVFLYEGLTANSVSVTYEITRSNYNVKDLKPDLKEKCSYSSCTIPLQSHKSCVTVENTNLKGDLNLKIQVRVISHRFWIFFISIIPLLGTLVYIKYGKEPNLVVSSGGMRMTGYELVDNEF